MLLVSFCFCFVNDATILYYARVAIGKKLLEPRYRGVEGHVSSRTHGQPAIGLSVLRPVTKTITLNRSFKVTVKPYQG